MDKEEFILMYDHISSMNEETAKDYLMRLTDRIIQAEFYAEDITTEIIEAALEGDY